jgi:hypothetical protein
VRHIILTILLLTASSKADGQWRVAVLGGSATSRGDARDDSDPAHPEFHADRPTTVTVAVARDAGRWRASVEGRHTTADLSEVSDAVAVTTFDEFEAWGAGVELNIRIAGHAPGQELRAACPSVLSTGELPEGFTARTGWRMGIVLGLARRL